MEEDINPNWPVSVSRECYINAMAIWNGEKIQIFLTCKQPLSLLHMKWNGREEAGRDENVKILKLHSYNLREVQSLQFYNILNLNFELEQGACSFTGSMVSVNEWSGQILTVAVGILISSTTCFKISRSGIRWLNQQPHYIYKETSLVLRVVRQPNGTKIISRPAYKGAWAHLREISP